MDPAFIQRIIAHYPSASAWNRFHLAQRLKRCPYDQLLLHLPHRGRLLDIGCGFAHFGWYLGEVRPNVEYFGCDIDTRKIALAQASLNGVGASDRFHVFAGDVRLWPGLPKDFHAILMLDVLYLLPQALQDALLNFALGLLAPDSDASLLLKILPPLRRWPRWRTFAQEHLMVALGKTKSSGAVLSTQDPERFTAWADAHRCESHTLALPTQPPSDLLILRPAV